jgi:hypothetical protein
MTAITGSVPCDLAPGGLFARRFGNSRCRRSGVGCWIVGEADWDIWRPAGGSVGGRTGVHGPFVIAVAGEVVLQFIDAPNIWEPLMKGGVAVRMLTHREIYYSKSDSN